MRILPTAKVVALAAIFTLPGPFATADSIELTHRFASGSRVDQIVTQLKSRTHGTPQIVIQRGIARSSELLDILRHGKIGLAVLSKTEVSRIDALGVFDLPFLVQNRKQVRNVVSGPARKILENAFQEQGLELLGVLDGSFRMVAATRRIDSVSELKGSKLRPVDRNSWKFFSSLGTSAMILPGSEVYAALQKGALDTFETTPEVMSLFGLTEVSRGLLLTRHLYDPLWLVGSRDRLNSLPSSQASALRAAAHQIEAASFADGELAEQRALLELRERGISVVALDPSERQWMVGVGRSLYDDYATRVKGGADLVHHFLRQATTN